MKKIKLRAALDAYMQLQLQAGSAKTDMLKAFNINIDFVDFDGD